MSKKVTHEQFLERARKVHGDKYEYLSEYSRVLHKIDILCSLHGIFKQTPSAHLQGQECPICGGSKKKDLNYLKAMAYQVNARCLSKEYLNIDSKYEFECIKCYHRWTTSGSHICHTKSSCPVCNSSKGEREVQRVLLNYGLKNNKDYFRQYKFDDCKYINKLLFDFYLPNVGERPVCIEFDGEQHSGKCRGTWSKFNFNEVTARDKIKTDYCNVNNIKLIRIPYFELKNIKIILDKELDRSKQKTFCLTLRWAIDYSKPIAA